MMLSDLPLCYFLEQEQWYTRGSSKRPAHGSLEYHLKYLRRANRQETSMDATSTHSSQETDNHVEVSVPAYGMLSLKVSALQKHLEPNLPLHVDILDEVQRISLN